MPTWKSTPRRRIEKRKATSTSISDLALFSILNYIHIIITEGWRWSGSCSGTLPWSSFSPAPQPASPSTLRSTPSTTPSHLRSLSCTILSLLHSRLFFRSLRVFVALDSKSYSDFCSKGTPSRMLGPIVMSGRLCRVGPSSSNIIFIRWFWWVAYTFACTSMPPNWGTCSSRRTFLDASSWFRCGWPFFQSWIFCSVRFDLSAGRGSYTVSFSLGWRTQKSPHRNSVSFRFINFCWRLCIAWNGLYRVYASVSRVGLRSPWVCSWWESWKRTAIRWGNQFPMAFALTLLALTDSSVE